MNKLFSYFYRSIPAKLFLINLAILIVFGMITVAVILSFRYMGNEMTRMFGTQMNLITKNAQIGRELARVIADTNLVVSTFFGKEDSLKTDGEHLVNRTDELMARCAEHRLKATLEKFGQKIRSVIEQCRAVNRTYREIQAIDQNINTTLIETREIVADKMFDHTMEGKDTAVMEQLTFMISGYRETLPHITIQFNQLGLAYFESAIKKENHPILTLLDDLKLRLRALLVPDPDIGNRGREMMAHVQRYKDKISEFHEVTEELGMRRGQLNQEKEGLLRMMAETDAQIARRTEQGTRELKNKFAWGSPRES